MGQIWLLIVSRKRILAFVVILAATKDGSPNHTSETIGTDHQIKFLVRAAVGELDNVLLLSCLSNHGANLLVDNSAIRNVHSQGVPQCLPRDHDARYGWVVSSLGR